MNKFKVPTATSKITNEQTTKNLIKAMSPVSILLIVAETTKLLIL